MKKDKKQIFGYEFEDADKVLKNVSSPIPEEHEDFGMPVGSRVGYAYSEDVNYKNQKELIAVYRNIALYSEADSAIEDIINEAIINPENKNSVSINLDSLNVKDTIKEKIRNEFDTVLNLLKFKFNAHEIFKQWYIDGEICYNMIIDKSNPRKGIVHLRKMDPMRTKLVIEMKDDENRTLNHLIRDDDLIKHYEYNISNEFSENHTYSNSPSQVIKLSYDSVARCTSGLKDRNRNIRIGYLNKAIKPFNQLRAMEDSAVVYRLARAPERKIFYVDVGDMPKIKAEAYLRDMMNRYKNKIDYDPNTGVIKDSRKHMSMLEDYWLPRRDGSRGTEISTLPGGQNLGDIEDIQFFKDKLYKSLNVPVSRLNQDNSFQLGRSSDIGRDEIKFSKFISRLRLKFTSLFNQILKTQLALKGVCTTSEFDEMEIYINYNWLKDSHFEELKSLEMMTDRINLLRDASEYAGKYFSINYIRKNILGQTEEDIQQIDNEIMDEISKDQLDDGMNSYEEERSFDFDLGDTFNQYVPEEEFSEDSMDFDDINNDEDEDYNNIMERIREKIDSK
jgi:hypothetical protein